LALPDPARIGTMAAMLPHRWLVSCLVASLSLACGSVEGGDGDGDGDGDGVELSVELDGASAGTVTSDPAGIDCGETCSATFAAGTEVTLTPAAGAASGFAGWAGDCSGLGACAVTLDAARSVTARFEPGFTIAGASQLGIDSREQIFEVATDADGNVIIAGTYDGVTNMGGDFLNSVLNPNGAPTSDIFVAKLDRDGGHIWSISLGSGGDNTDEINGVVVDGDGNVLIAGQYTAEMTIGDDTLPRDASNDTFLAKLAGATGAPIWARGFVGPNVVRTNGLALDSNGDVIVTFFFKQTADFGDGVVTSNGGDDVVIGKYSGANGAHIWSEHFGGTPVAGAPADDQVTAVAVDGDDNVLVFGFFFGTINFGGSNLVQTGSDRDAFLARFDGDGNHDWSRSYGSSGAVFTGAGAVTGGGDFVVGGSFSGTADFGGDPFTNETGDTGLDIFIARFSGADGDHVWSQQFAGPGFKRPVGFGFLSNGDPVVAGFYELDVDFAGIEATNAARRNWWVARLAEASGAPIWLESFGDSQGAGGGVGRALAVGDGDRVHVGGDFNDTVDFGAGSPFTSGAPAVDDGAVVHLDL
jgi:hypothetical protein